MTPESPNNSVVEMARTIVEQLDLSWDASDDLAMEHVATAERLLAQLCNLDPSERGQAALGTLTPLLSVGLHQLEEDFRVFLSRVGSHPVETTARMGLARCRMDVLRRLIRALHGGRPQDQLPFLIGEAKGFERQLRETNDEAQEKSGVSGVPLESLRVFQVEILKQRGSHLLRESTQFKTQSDVDSQLELAYVIGRGLGAVSKRLRRRREAGDIDDAITQELEQGMNDEWKRLREFILHSISHCKGDASVDEVGRVASLIEGELDEVRLDSHDTLNPLPIERLGSAASDGRRFARSLKNAGRQHPDLASAAKRTAGLSRRIADIRNDRILRGRLNRLFTPRLVIWWESLVFWLIIFVLGLIFYDQAADTPEMGWTMWADTGICCVLLLDFFVRMALTPARFRYFLRNALTDFLPSLPLGFLASLGRVGWISGVRALRLVRVFRVLRFMRPVIRLVRLMLFAIRAVDRVVDRNARWLNRNIVFFADPDDKEATPALIMRVREMDAWVTRELKGLYRQLPLSVRLPATDRRVEIMRVTARFCASDISLAVAAGSDVDASDVDIDVEDVIELLRSLDDTQVADLIGPDVAARITSSLRFFRLPFLRKLPLVKFVLGPSGAPEPLMTTARLGNVMGELLDRIQRCVLWFADLYGTITGAQFLDRLGLSMVRATSRPAKRLLMFGVIALLLMGLVELTQLDFLHTVFGSVLGFLSLPVLVLGCLCLIPLLIGLWFRRIAGQAVDFYERVAEAQFLSLTEIRKEAFALGRLGDLTDRAIIPEARLYNHATDADLAEIHTEIRARAGGETQRPLPDDESLVEWSYSEAMLLFFRDFLDGAYFHQNDTKIANLLLGNLTLENIRVNRLGLNRKEIKKLGRLDLTRSRGGFFGPYAWFNFITHSVAQKTARLIIDYNRFCIPRDERAVAPAKGLAAFHHWVSKGRVLHGLEEGSGELPDDGPPAADTKDLEYRTTEFNALHFLDADRDRDAAVAQRFGPEVAELLKLDRMQLIREIFGSYPVHALSRERRTLNPFVFHQKNFASGRVFLFPFKVAWLSFRVLCGFVMRVIRVVRDLLYPDVAAHPEKPLADLETARRKIHRMRRPIVMETVQLRARFDGQYLGLRFSSELEPLPKEHLLEADLLKLSATEREWQHYRLRKEGAEERLRALRRVLAEAGVADGDLSKSVEMAGRSPEGRRLESVRAAVTAFLTDHSGLASLVASRDRLRRLNALAEEGLLTRRWRNAFAGSRRALMARVEALWPHVSPDNSDDADARERFSRALRARWRQERSHVAKVLESVPQGSTIPDHVLSVLLDVASNPSSWTEQLVAIRCVQTLGLMDIEGYEEHIARLGGFELEPALQSAGARRL